MKKVSLFLASVLSIALSAHALTESGGCYQIGSADDLYEFAELFTAYYEDSLPPRLDCAKLTQNIVVNTNVLKEDGSPNAGPFRKWNLINDFAGVFDGQGHTISGLYQLDTTSDAGFLAAWKGPLTVKDLGIVDSYFAVDFDDSEKGNYSAASLVAYSGDTLIVENCFSAATVEMYTFSDAVGGLVGGTSKLAVIRNSYNEGVVRVTDERTQGSVDYYRFAPAGGLVGEAGSKSAVRIENSYNAGPISGLLYVGGLVGNSEKAEYDPCKIIF